MNDTVKLILSGDFVPINQNVLLKNIFSSDLLGSIKSFDLHITNLECPLTNSETKIKKSGPHLKAIPSAVAQLIAAKVNAVCLANNHIFDFGEKGTLDTIDACEKYGIETLGIVNRYDKKKAYLLKEINGKKVCLLNYCESEFSVRGKNEIGANGYDYIKCYYEITRLRKEADYLVVIYHGGNEMYPLPNPHIKKLFHFLIDIGTDAIISHHTHVFSGIESYNSKPIVYGLGNFFFYEPNSKEDWHYGILAGLTLNDEINVEIFPIKQCAGDFKVNLCREDEKNRVMEKIRSLSQVILNDKELENQWEQFINENKDGVIKNILGLKKYERFLFRFPYLRNMIISKSQILSVYNLIRCESLRRLVKKSLKSEIDT